VTSENANTNGADEPTPFVMDETTMPHLAVLREFTEGDDVEGHVAHLDTHRMADEIATLREQLAAAKREIKEAGEHATAVVQMFHAARKAAHEQKHRAERLAEVVEAARAWDAVCDTDAAQQAADEWDAVAETVPGYAAACEALSAALRTLDAGDAP
jgi:chromosome segregation ATPase